MKLIIVHDEWAQLPLIAIGHCMCHVASHQYSHSRMPPATIKTIYQIVGYMQICSDEYFNTYLYVSDMERALSWRWHDMGTEL